MIRFLIKTKGNCARKWPHAFIFVLLLMLGWLTSFAQYRFDSWTTDNGLPQNGVRSITQSPDGYLWLTTFDGLVRFDGVKFTVFNKSNSPGIINNRFLSVRAFADGSIWAATEGSELTIYRNGKFISYTADQVPEKAIYGFEPDENGEPLINIDSKLYYLRDGQFIFARATDDDGTLKFILRPKSGGRWEIYPNEAKHFKDDRMTSYSIRLEYLNPFLATVYEDKKGGLWISDNNKMLYLFEGSITEYTKKDGVPPNVLGHTFWEEPDGSVWFATGGFSVAGVGLVRIRDGKFSRFGIEQGLSNDRIFLPFKDREGTIWLATDKGLNRLRQQIVSPLSVNDGLIHNEVYPILRSRDGSIYAGTVGGLSRYKDGKFTNMPLLHKTEIGTRAAQSLFEDKNGDLWIGVIGGLFILKDGKLKDLTEKFDTPDTINAIYSNDDGVVWFGTEHRGILQYKDGTITTALTTAEGLADNNVKFINRSNDGSLWIGTYGGVSVVECTGQTACKVEKSYTTVDGLASNYVRSIYQETDGTYWVGTYDGGISRFRDGKFFNFNTGNGLFSDGAFAIVEDKQGRFWVTSNQGIYSVDKADLNAVADGRATVFTTSGYGKQDGMLNTECNGGRQPSSMTDDQGRIWFPTIEGIAIVDPNLVHKNPLAPPVAIETVEIDRAKVNFDDSIRVEPSQTQLDINYTGLSFIKSDQMHFRYKLGGLDKDWIEAGTRRNVSYSHLPPGEYTFSVTAANTDGVWNPDGKSVRIIVLAPFYKTWLFAGLVLLVCFGIGYLAYSYRVGELNKRNLAQENFAHQLIESQEAERKRIAQEIHDGLGQSLLVIKNRASLGLAASEKSKADEQFDEIQGSVTDALSEVRVISQNLRPLHLERLGLTSTLEEMIEQLDEASDIEISCDIEQIDGLLSPENEMNLYRIVQECLNNVVKHSKATNAGVTVTNEQRNIAVTVRDNGIGFDREVTANARGLGLNGIVERTKILGGSLSIESDPGGGTTVQLNIPTV